MTDLTRNTLGHLDACNYSDWVDFSKCQCAEGLACVPKQAQAYTVAPMPLRDYFAATVDVPWDVAAMVCSDGVGRSGKLLCVTVIDVRAQLRYAEADAMIAARAAPREGDEPGER